MKPCPAIEGHCKLVLLEIPDFSLIYLSRSLCYNVYYAALGHRVTKKTATNSFPLLPVLLKIFLYFLQKFPQFQDFIVIHDYLVTPESRMQARIRRRGQSGKYVLIQVF